MAVNINIPKPIIDYNDLENKPTLVTEHSELNLDDGTNPHGTTASDVGALPMPTGTTSEYLRGDGSLETFPTIPSITGLVPETRTINGLDLSANRTLTINNLGFFRLDFTPSSVVTTTSPTQVLQVTIPANTIKSLDGLRIYMPVIKTGVANTLLLRMKLSTSATMPSGNTDRIATFTTGATNNWVPFQRKPTVNGSTLTIYTLSNSAISDLNVLSSQTPSTLTYDFTQPLYLYLEGTLADASDSFYLAGGYITNL